MENNATRKLVLEIGSGSMPYRISNSSGRFIGATCDKKDAELLIESANAYALLKEENQRLKKTLSDIIKLLQQYRNENALLKEENQKLEKESKWNLEQCVKLQMELKQTKGRLNNLCGMDPWITDPQMKELFRKNVYEIFVPNNSNTPV